MRIIATYESGIVTFGFMYGGEHYIVRGRRHDGPQILAHVCRYLANMPIEARDFVGAAWNTFAFNVLGT